MPRKLAPKKQKNRHFKDKQQMKLTATINNNIENLMMDKAQHHKKRMKVVKQAKEIRPAQ